MMTKEWTAVHRKHHALCETEEDPHSPQVQVQGLSEILWRQTEAYQRCAADLDVLEQYGIGTPDDWVERYIYTQHSYLGIVVLLLLDVLLFGVIGIMIWAIQMTWIPLLGGAMNGIGHCWGYRNFECPDAARNIVSWEFDIGWLWIHLF